MSFTQLVFPEKEYNIINPSPVSNMLSLNEIFRESIKKAQSAVDSLDSIVRCENLPLVRGNYEQVTQLFDRLLEMIFRHSAKGSRLFLHVDCTEYTGEAADPFLEKETRRYLIKFHTNIATSESWHTANNDAIAVCKQILSELNGNLVVNSVSSTGCLFAVTLPGKFE